MAKSHDRRSSEPASLQRTVDETSKGGGVVKSYPISRPTGHGEGSSNQSNPASNR